VITEDRRDIMDEALKLLASTNVFQGDRFDSTAEGSLVIALALLEVADAIRDLAEKQ